MDSRHDPESLLSEVAATAVAPLRPRGAPTGDTGLLTGRVYVCACVRLPVPVPAPDPDHRRQARPRRTPRGGRTGPRARRGLGALGGRDKRLRRTGLPVRYLGSGGRGQSQGKGRGGSRHGGACRGGGRFHSWSVGRRGAAVGPVDRWYHTGPEVLRFRPFPVRLLTQRGAIPGGLSPRVLAPVGVFRWSRTPDATRQRGMSRKARCTTETTSGPTGRAETSPTDSSGSLFPVDCGRDTRGSEKPESWKLHQGTV